MKQHNKILRKALTEVSAADACIRQTTDDQLLLWLASDALDQAAHDLECAIGYANAARTLSPNELFELRLRLMAVAALQNYVGFLRLFPPQLLVFPLFVTQLALLFGGTPWLLFGLHVPYQFVLVFVLANLVSFQFVCHIPDKQVLWLLDKSTDFAKSAEHDWQLLLTHSLEDSTHDQSIDALTYRH